MPARTAPTIRPMTPADAAPAAAAVLAGGWGDRGPFFEFATRAAGCRPFVAEADGAIVGTGVATVNGPVGWVGTIFVSPEQRGRGLGLALTTTVVDALEGAGCRTLVLVATQLGRPLYEGIGFSLQTTYRTVEAPGLGSGDATAARPTADPLPDARVRPYEPGDLEAIVRTLLYGTPVSPEVPPLQGVHYLCEDTGLIDGGASRIACPGGSRVSFFAVDPATTTQATVDALACQRDVRCEWRHRDERLAAERAFHLPVLWVEAEDVGPRDAPDWHEGQTHLGGAQLLEKGVAARLAHLDRARLRGAPEGRRQPEVHLRHPAGQHVGVEEAPLEPGRALTHQAMLRRCAEELGASAPDHRFMPR